MRCYHPQSVSSQLPLSQLKPLLGATILPLLQDSEVGVVAAGIRAVGAIFTRVARYAATKEEPQLPLQGVELSPTNEPPDDSKRLAKAMLEDIQGALKDKLSAGPKDVVLEVLRTYIRAIPSVPMSVRDGFILRQVRAATVVFAPPCFDPVSPIGFPWCPY